MRNYKKTGKQIDRGFCSHSYWFFCCPSSHVSVMNMALTKTIKIYIIATLRIKVIVFSVLLFNFFILSVLYVSILTLICPVNPCRVSQLSR